jgi:hypothetical protein
MQRLLADMQATPAPVVERLRVLLNP